MGDRKTLLELDSNLKQGSRATRAATGMEP